METLEKLKMSQPVTQPAVLKATANPGWRGVSGWDGFSLSSLRTRCPACRRYFSASLKQDFKLKVSEAVKPVGTQRQECKMFASGNKNEI